MSEVKDFGTIEEHSFGKGILGAITMGIAASLVFVIIGCIGYVSAWIGFLMAFSACWGFKRFAGSIKRLDAVICGLIALALVYPACMIVVGYWMYDEIFKGTAATLFDVLRSTPWLLEKYPDIREDSFYMLLVQAFIYTGLGVLMYLFSFSSQKKAEALHQVTLRQTGSKKVQLAIVGCIFGGVALGAVLMIVLMQMGYDSVGSILGVVLIFGGIIAGTVLSVKSQPATLTFNDNGFLYNDRAGHKVQKLVTWETIKGYSVDEFSGVITLEGKLGGNYELNPKYFDDVKPFTDKLDSLFGAVDDPYAVDPAKYDQSAYLQ